MEPVDRLCSAEIAGFQGRIGLIDDLQFLLGGLVAAMRVRVVLLDEDLVPRLEVHRGKGRLEVEDGERLIARRGRARRRFRLMTIRPPIAPLPGAILRAMAIKAERVAHPGAIARGVALAELPSRALPHGVVPDLRLDLGLAHPGIVVPGAVVGADVFQAEPVVAVEFEARSRRAEIRPGVAAGVVAQAYRRIGLGREDRVDWNAPHSFQYGWRAVG